MSFGVPGGFTGGDALLAFAAVQQGRLNEQMTDAMQLADLRSQMSADLADIKAHLQEANKDPTGRFPGLDAELQAFMDKYGDVAELGEVTSAVGEIATSVHDKVGQYNTDVINNGNGYSKAHADWVAGGEQGPEPTLTPVTIGGYASEDIKTWTDHMTEQLSASGTSDQLSMIYIKQINDSINNSSGMVSGIDKSRSDGLAAIIRNF
jgi:hypothetical protein